MVRKAWVKPNFKQGGSVRCVQLAPGGGGKAGGGVAAAGAINLWLRMLSPSCNARMLLPKAPQPCPAPCLALPPHAELLYPSGMFRKPLRVAVKRGVVNSPAWRIGAYLVLDTGV